MEKKTVPKSARVVSPQKSVILKASRPSSFKYTIEELQEKVKNMNSSEIKEMISYRCPPSGILKLLQVVSVMFGNSKEQWKKTLSQSMFTNKLKEYNSNRIDANIKKEI